MGDLYWKDKNKKLIWKIQRNELFKKQFIIPFHFFNLIIHTWRAWNPFNPSLLMSRISYSLITLSRPFQNFEKKFFTNPDFQASHPFPFIIIPLSHYLLKITKILSSHVSQLSLFILICFPARLPEKKKCQTSWRKQRYSLNNHWILVHSIYKKYNQHFLSLFSHLLQDLLILFFPI